ncbi:MAG: hypothetical protein H7A24_02730 [Leptospiraceae bacterium]|nr:hypothetical protein [Leptospiraceae bacterium]MCP5510765.1 hypothetical protein [Leptospiraceae bacterium]
MHLLRSLGSLLLNFASWVLPDTDQKNIRTTIAIVLTTNAIPILGIYFFGWSGVFILYLYWSESVFIGLFNILRMLFAAIQPGLKEDAFWLVRFAGGLFFSLFFLVHYGGFMTGHFIFLTAFSGGMTGNFDIWSRSFQIIESYFLPPYPVHSMIEFLDSEFIAVLGIFLSQASEFKFYFWDKKEYLRVPFMDYMMKPYGRVFVMHLTIILGAIVMVFLGIIDKAGDNIGMVVVWILLKVIYDFKSLKKNLSTKTIEPKSTD